MAVTNEQLELDTWNVL